MWIVDVFGWLVWNFLSMGSKFVEVVVFFGLCRRVALLGSRSVVRDRATVVVLWRYGGGSYPLEYRSRTDGLVDIVPFLDRFARFLH